jgi:hypothetical protein
MRDAADRVVVLKDEHLLGAEFAGEKWRWINGLHQSNDCRVRQWRGPGFE